MGKTLLITLLGASLALAGCAQQTPTENQNANQPTAGSNQNLENKNYIDTDYGIQFSYPSQLQIILNDCSGWNPDLGIKKCIGLQTNNFDALKRTGSSINFSIAALDSNADPVSIFASATDSVKKVTKTINNRQWNFVWVKGSAGCDGPEPAGCNNIGIIAYTKDNNMTFVFLDNVVKNTDDASISPIQSIIESFGIK